MKEKTAILIKTGMTVPQIMDVFKKAISATKGTHAYEYVYGDKPVTDLPDDERVMFVCDFCEKGGGFLFVFDDYSSVEYFPKGTEDNFVKTLQEIYDKVQYVEGSAKSQSS